MFQNTFSHSYPHRQMQCHQTANFQHKNLQIRELPRKKATICLGNWQKEQSHGHMSSFFSKNCPSDRKLRTFLFLLSQQLSPDLSSRFLKLKINFIISQENTFQPKISYLKYLILPQHVWYGRVHISLNHVSLKEAAGSGIRLRIKST